MNYLKLMQTPKPYVIDHRNFPIKLWKRAKYLCWRLNSINPLDTDKRNLILTKLLSKSTQAQLSICSPFSCEFGFNIKAHHFLFLNDYVRILDTSPVVFGKDVLVGPRTCIVCAGHSIDYKQRHLERNENGLSTSRPIMIGNNIWIGANCTIIGGVKIGDHSVIGAGSVVTRNIPANVVAFGNPCRVYRKITSRDKIKPTD